MKISFVAAVLALVAIGCDPYVAPLTVAPVSAVAEVDSYEDTARLSEGIALAIECSYSGDPCESAVGSSSDESIVRVMPAYVDQSTSADAYQRTIDSVPRSVFVLFGVKPGHATVSIKTDSGDGQADLEVEILPLP